jgi:hypothetical protein
LLLTHHYVVFMHISSLRGVKQYCCQHLRNEFEICIAFVKMDCYKSAMEFRYRTFYLVCSCFEQTEVSSGAQLCEFSRRVVNELSMLYSAAVWTTTYSRLSLWSRGGCAQRRCAVRWHCWSMLPFAQTRNVQARAVAR